MLFSKRIFKEWKNYIIYFAAEIKSSQTSCFLDIKFLDLLALETT